MPLADVAAQVWYGRSPAAQAARTLLSPLSLLYRMAIGRINARHDRAPAVAGPIPSVSIGNVTVGGTGKTPVSAWLASRLREAGARPAVVLRGYGDDEVLVHRLLNPDVPVLADAERVRGVERAAREGADVAILDDAFQHRRAARVADIVLLSADRWTGAVRLLPAGPFREPLESLQRASLVLITVKAASAAQVRATIDAVRAVTDSTVVTVDLQPASFINVASGEARTVESFRGTRVLAVSGIGDPAAFAGQLTRLALQPVPMVFADHHAYRASDVTNIMAGAAGVDAVVCTLKDAVKLGPLWPGQACPLWYLSQSVVPRDGADVLDAVIQSVLLARRNGPTSSDLSR